MKNAKEAESGVIFLKLRAMQEPVVIETVRRDNFGTCATTKYRQFFKIYYYSNTLLFAHYVSYNHVDPLEAFRRIIVNILSK